MSGSINQDQKRAAFAWKKVTSDLTKDYTVLANSAPALILNNGLMQTLAYYETKSDSARQLQQHICKWLQEKKLVNQSNFISVMDKLHSTEDSRQYRQATDESLKLLRWIRQFAKTNISD